MMIKKYFEYIGIRSSNNATKKDSNKTEEEKKVETYIPSGDIKIAERYLTYLKEIDNYQKDRRTTIENKNSQLVGQASIVTSIFALFVPLLFDNLNGIANSFKILIIVTFLVVLFHYLLTIFHAIQTLKINKYKYATRSTSTITKLERAVTELDFMNEEIDDLIFTVNQTAPIDNLKGGNLILGARCFEIANMGFGFMTLLIIFSTFTIKKEVPEIRINNPQEIKLNIPDTLNTKIHFINKNKSLNNCKDSIKANK
jgi:hypothetical protein